MIAREAAARGMFPDHEVVGADSDAPPSTDVNASTVERTSPDALSELPRVWQIEERRRS